MDGRKNRRLYVPRNSSGSIKFKRNDQSFDEQRSEIYCRHMARKANSSKNKSVQKRNSGLRDETGSSCSRER